MSHTPSHSPDNKPTFNTFQEVASAFGMGIRQITDNQGKTRFVFSVPGQQGVSTSNQFATDPNQTPDQFFNKLMNNQNVRRFIGDGTLTEPNITTEGPGTAPTIKATPQQDFNPDTRLAKDVNDAVALTRGNVSNDIGGTSQASVAPSGGPGTAGFGGSPTGGIPFGGFPTGGSNQPPGLPLTGNPQNRPGGSANPLGLTSQGTSPIVPPASSGGPFDAGNPLGKPNTTGVDPFTSSPGEGGGTFFRPDFQFDIDPNDVAAGSGTEFINSLMRSLGPAIASGEFTNFFEQAGATGNQNQNTAEGLFNQLGGGDPFTSLLRNQGANALSDPQGFNTPGIQGFLENELRSGISGGGISDNFVNAARERILGPSNEALRGRLNQQGGGVASLDSGLFQELQRRQEADFNNDLQLFAGSNLNNLLGQAGQLGGQQFGQSFANLGFGAGAQGQLQGQLAQLGRDQGQLGLGQQGLALQGQGQRNEFGLTQQQIANQLVQTLITGSREGGFPWGALLSGLLNNTGDFADIFRGDDTKDPATDGNNNRPWWADLPKATIDIIFGPNGPSGPNAEPIFPHPDGQVVTNPDGSKEWRWNAQ